MDQKDGRDVLLCGSIPFEDTGAVMSAEAAALGDRLLRVPDGETGPRANWIAWQYSVFARQPAFEPLEHAERDYQLRPPFRLKPGASAGDIDFGTLGFVDAALASYALFRRRRQAGDFLPEARFQVCLPTPFAPVYSFTDYASQEAVYPRYEAAMLAELARLASEIPAEDLAVQWDVATEMSLFEKVYPAPMDDPDRVLMARLAKLGDAVPAGVELGYHLCYGSMNNRHWKEPDDLAKLVWVANRLAGTVGRPIDWVHMPVPIDRDDDAYFAPLAALGLGRDTALFLGLLHLADGLPGAGRRAAAAARQVRDFGIAAECGFGRMEAEQSRTLLDLHRQAADALG
ncbi:MAG: hypothetical protein OEO83_18985 [Alphaproteobacteria bacterium]|nr:hypothetical protein [Alphaproteobacteria bacterium]